MSFAAPAAAGIGSILSNPNTWQVISAGAGIFSALGAKKEGSQQQMAYDSNAAMYQADADATRQASALNEFKQRKRLKQIVGSQTAMYGARGVAADSGSPIDVMAADLATGFLDIAIDNYNYETEARRSEYKGSLSRYYGTQAESAGSTIGGTNLLKTAADFGMAMTKMKIGSGK